MLPEPRLSWSFLTNAMIYSNALMHSVHLQNNDS
jgi:hypothetical protein